MTNVATGGKIGISNPFSEYIKFLPGTVPLPTFWDESERALLTGTSLEAALEAKLKSLNREFSLLREKTSSIAWCQQCWWDAKIGKLTFDDWKMVDAMYRSRALDLPGTGAAVSNVSEPLSPILSRYWSCETGPRNSSLSKPEVLSYKHKTDTNIS